MNKRQLIHIVRGVMALSSALVLSGCLLELPGRGSTRAEQPPSTRVAESASMQMARSAFTSGRYGIAISHLERELSVRPESVAALNGLGAAYDQIGRFEVAQGYYFRALELASDPTTTLANLGYSRQLQGNPDEAAKILQLALYYGPHNEVANKNLQTVRRQLAAQAYGDVSTTYTSSEPTPQAVSMPLHAEVSNGRGLIGMARRVRGILRELCARC